MKWILIVAIGLAVLALLGALLVLAVSQPMSPDVSGRSQAAPVDPERLQAHVRTLAETFLPRDSTHPGNLKRAAAYIRQEFAQAGGRVIEQEFRVEGSAYQNISGMFGPDTADRIVVGAHYDAVDNVPGADDNASGVAGLLELARLLGRTTLPVKTELVAFTLEEPPYFRTDWMGSYVHAKALWLEKVPIRLMVCLEMIGYFDSRPNSQGFPMFLMGLLYPRQGDFIAVVGRFEEWRTVRRVKRVMQAATPLPVCSINAPAFVPGIDFSDHLNYWRAGYPAVMITDTAFYRNHNYHTERDGPATLDYRRMAMAVQDVYAVVLDAGR